ncbi:MAG: hypothetical protein EOO53_08695 [Gammaproteobacteria bacterium]|nr:MAG: hypothetical protein EOO53_08695 [Gammaproteobacteria bacterium]
MKQPARFLKIFSLALLPLVIAACSTYKTVDGVRSSVDLPETPAAFTLPQSATNQEPVAAWWSQFNDEQLNGLISSALVQNHSLRIAQASLAESRALLRNSSVCRSCECVHCVTRQSIFIECCTAKCE